MWILGSFSKKIKHHKKKTQEQANFTIDFGEFFFEPSYFGLYFCCP
jgi:hypothetical protein